MPPQSCFNNLPECLPVGFCFTLLYSLLTFTPFYKKILISLPRIMDVKTIRTIIKILHLINYLIYDLSYNAIQFITKEIKFTTLLQKK